MENGGVISGGKNLELFKELRNQGNVKKMTNWFMKQPAAEGRRRNVLSYDKREFVPFTEERDHIGRIIQNVKYINDLVLGVARVSSVHKALREKKSRVQTQKIIRNSL